MKLLVLDGNSIINRAFYGIKLLTTKDGRFTNGIYGFMTILLRLRDECNPDGIVVAFDLKKPTFRHEMYSEYKAGRKGMPDELAQQMPVLKELLKAIGCTVLEKEGFEADDILGTLSHLCCEDSGFECVIATGDRDSLQLVNEETTVFLASTKMGRPVTVHYTPDRVLEDYSVTPKQLIDIKALMGDSSDNIPGVAGVGQKTAIDLISKFGNIDYIYEHLDELEIKSGVREKLRNGKDSAYLSRTLGTICCEVPIETDLQSYLMKTPDTFAATSLLTSLEMFSMIEKLNLPAAEMRFSEEEIQEKQIALIEEYDLDSLLQTLKQSGEVWFDCEYESGYIVELLLTVDGETVYKTACASLMFPTFIKSFLEDADVKKNVTDSKSLYAYAVRNGINVCSVNNDLMLTGYVLNPSANSYSVDRLAQEYSVMLQKSDNEKVSAVAAMPKLFETMLAKIKENGQEELLYDIEIPLAAVLADMEVYGFRVDSEGIEIFGSELEEQINSVKESVFDEIGFEFNLNSPKQLGEALFEKMGIPAKKKTKSGYSTNAEVLQSLAYDYPVVSKILEYRTLSKLKSTYCDGLLKVVLHDGRIHSSFNQTETRTGRISSTEPNLQNIPVRSEIGSQMRKFFKAREGGVLVDADYSQIELRVLADIADDPVMIKAFNDGDDIHTITASQVFSMPAEMVTPLMRSRAKAVNFGIVYGIGAFSLSKDIGVTVREADSYIKGYLDHYSGVARYMEQVVAESKESGYAKTTYGRRRYLPELSSSNGNLRAFGERVARNMPIQGTAADIIKLAMVRVHKRLKDEGMKARLILQVHDELIVEAPENEAEKAAKILKYEMENVAPKMKVGLLADVGMGTTWYEAKR
ncbi:MAG: DNA polymerase I [Clostridia bacterium]|nr:DNA polymerase I [Clostridia bacterium]